MRALRRFSVALAAILAAILALPITASAMPINVTGKTTQTGNMTWRAWDDAYKQLNETGNGGKVDYCNANTGEPVGDVIGDGTLFEFKGGWKAEDVYKLSPMTCASTVGGQKITWRCDISAENKNVGSGHSTKNQRQFHVKCGNRFTQSEFNLYYNKLKGLCTGDKCGNSLLFSGELKKAIVSCQNNSKVAADCVNNRLKTLGFGLKMDEATKAVDEVGKQIDEAAKQAEASEAESDNAETEKASCQIAGIGWMICPIVNFGAQAADSLYGLISGFLEVDSSMFDVNSASYAAYRTFLPIANIILAILFILIIYSEATGNGFGALSNYTIKKMLPRLVIFAMLVNLSWWLCAAAVDFSNILGANLKDFFSNTGQSSISDIAYSSPGWASTANSVLTGTVGGGLAVAGTLATLGGAVAFHQLAPLAMLILGVIIVLVGVFLILIIRQAGVILLCVVAPVAIAAALLPNTKSIFNKWWKFMLTLLIMYPLVAIIFGASAMASDVITAQAGNDWSMQLAGQVCRVLPLIVTPFAIISCFKGLGKFAAAAAGFATGRASGMKARAKKSSKENYMNSNARRATVLRAKQGIGKRVTEFANKHGVRAPAGAYQWATAADKFDNERNDQQKEFAKQRLIASSSQDQQKQIAMDGTYRDSKGNIQRVDAATRQAALELQWGKMNGQEQDKTLHNIADMNADRINADVETQSNPSGHGSTMVQRHNSESARQDYQKVAGTVLEQMQKAGDKSKASLSMKDANDLLSGAFNRVDAMGRTSVDYEQVAQAHERYISSRSQEDLQGASASQLKGWYNAMDDALRRAGQSGQQLHDETVKRVNESMGGGARAYMNQQNTGRTDRSAGEVHDMLDAVANGRDVKY